jgi:colanic acid biosynthesis glycosyl transferase WcaI
MNRPNASSKKILVIGINFSPELTGIGKYTGDMVDWFVDNNYECTVVTAFPYYPFWKVQEPYLNKFYKREVLKDGKLTIYRCPLYIPEKPGGLKRLIHEATFFLSAFFTLIYLLFKPKNDYIFCIAPPFHLGFLGLVYRFFKRGEIIYHIQDLQIEAARDLNMLKSKKAFKILFGMERFIMRKVDFVSSISKGMLKKISYKINREISFFPNWVDTDACYPLSNCTELKLMWNFDANDKVVLYSGSIGEKQGIEAILDVAEKLRAVKFIKFVICGTGPHKDKLIQRAKTQQLDNVSFLPLQERHLFNSFLNMADVHLVLQKKSAADLVMPSKLTTILAVGGLALVTADQGTTLYEVINDNNMGVVIPPEDIDHLKNAILNCCTSDNSEIKLNARNYAENHLNISKVIKRMMSNMQKTVYPEPKGIKYLRLDRDADQKIS